MGTNTKKINAICGASKFDSDSEEEEEDSEDSGVVLVEEEEEGGGGEDQNAHAKPATAKLEMIQLVIRK
jgi:hypothetical protein